MVKKKGLRIIWDDEAKKSLRSIYEFIKTREAGSVAKRVRNTIAKQAKDLSLLPEKLLKNHIWKTSEEISATKLFGAIKLSTRLQLRQSLYWIFFILAETLQISKRLSKIEVKRFITLPFHEIRTTDY